MPTIKINDINIYYELHGAGEPLVLIGGFGADHLGWLPVVNFFKKHYQVLVFDNRGAGQSDAPPGPYSVEQMADDVSELCIQLNINKAHFIGNSMGGFIVQSLAVRYPQQVKSAIISNSDSHTEYCFLVYMGAQRELLQYNESLKAVLQASYAWLFSSSFLSQKNMLAYMLQLGLDNPYPFSLNGYDGQHTAIRGFDSRPWIHQLHAPALILSATDDLVFREHSVRAFAEKIVHAEYSCFSRCGHLPHIEYPEQFFAITHAFMGKLV